MPRWTGSRTFLPGGNASADQRARASKPGCANWPASACCAPGCTAPHGERFRRPSKPNARSYNTDDVDALCLELLGYFEDDQPTERGRGPPRRVPPAKGQEGYEESQVDAFLDRVVELMAAID